MSDFYEPGGKVVKRWVEVSFQREGVHSYPQALSDPELADVAFLGHPHRHLFHFYVKLEVFHNDREVEFLQLKKFLQAQYDIGLLQLDHRSCEMLAQELALMTSGRYPRRDMVVRVYEDGENGAIIEYEA